MPRKLTIVRKKAIQGCAAGYYVRINGREVAKLNYGETVTVEIPAESVSIDALSRSMKSDPVTIPPGSCDLYAEIRHKVGIWSTTLEIVLQQKEPTWQASTPPTPTTYNPTPRDPAQPVIIFCPQCGAKLRVPGGNAKLNVTCPKCQHRFFWSEQPAPKSTNELDDYQKGGSLYLALYTKPNTAHDAAVALIATFSASMIANSLFGHEGELWDLLNESHASINYIDLLYTQTEVMFTCYLRNAPIPNYTYRYTYSEFINGHEKETIVLAEAELPIVRRMALSNLVELMPDAYMREGRIYEKKY